MAVRVRSATPHAHTPHAVRNGSPAPEKMCTDESVAGPHAAATPAPLPPPPPPRLLPPLPPAAPSHSTATASSAPHDHATGSTLRAGPRSSTDISTGIGTRATRNARSTEAPFTAAPFTADPFAAAPPVTGAPLTASLSAAPSPPSPPIAAAAAHSTARTPHPSARPATPPRGPHPSHGAISSEPAAPPAAVAAWRGGARLACPHVAVSAAPPTTITAYGMAGAPPAGRRSSSMVAGRPAGLRATTTDGGAPLLVGSPHSTRSPRPHLAILVGSGGGWPHGCGRGPKRRWAKEAVVSPEATRHSVGPSTSSHCVRASSGTSPAQSGAAATDGGGARSTPLWRTSTSRSLIESSTATANCPGSPVAKASVGSRCPISSCTTIAAAASRQPAGVATPTSEWARRPPASICASSKRRPSSSATTSMPGSEKAACIVNTASALPISRRTCDISFTFTEEKKQQNNYRHCSH
eukprot:scaffold28966_cov90-Isochrysis_galbana.AAC.2